MAKEEVNRGRVAYLRGYRVGRSVLARANPGHSQGRPLDLLTSDSSWVNFFPREKKGQEAEARRSELEKEKQAAGKNEGAVPS